MTETETKWAERVQGWKASGQSAEEYSLVLGIKASTLRWWASKLSRLERAGADGIGPSFPSVPMVRVSRRRAADASMTVRIGTAQIEVRQGFDGALLRELIEALGDRT